MKTLTVISTILILLSLQACTAASQNFATTNTPAEVEVTVNISTPSSEPALAATQIVVPPAITANAGGTIMPLPTANLTTSPNVLFSPDEITLVDNRATVQMNVGDSFLLNLGADIYNWSVEVDDQNVLSREKNIMVIRGAQGIYQAHNPGTAILSATGDPPCRQSTPQCMLPSMIFEITVIVQ